MATREDEGDDQYVSHSKRPRYNQSAQKKSSTQKRTIKCHCDRHQGRAIRSDQWKRCQNQNIIKSIRPDPQLHSTSRFVPVKKPSPRQKSQAQSTAERSTALEDYVHHDTTLPSLPGEVSDEEVVDNSPMGCPGAVPGIEYTPNFSDDDQFSRSLSDRSAHMSDYSEPEVGDKDNDSDSESWRTSTSEASDRDADAISGVRPISELLPVPEFVPPPDLSDDDTQFDGDVHPNSEPGSSSYSPPGVDAQPYSDSDMLTDDDVQAGVDPLSQAPNHIRFFELLALQFQTHFGMPKAGVEYFLKSINWSLNPGGALAQWKEEPTHETGKCIV
ncbi:hypothetical protein FRC07_002630 [Ceratobasidium sp. 392]|nr:hypothetical protein FRC07_002630 [Ceratobasidium sp. 392]